MWVIYPYSRLHVDPDRGWTSEPALWRALQLPVFFFTHVMQTRVWQNSLGPTFSQWWVSQVIYMNCVLSNYIFAVERTDGLMQERRNSIANALELRLSCINPSTCVFSLWNWIDEHPHSRSNFTSACFSKALRTFFSEETTYVIIQIHPRAERANQPHRVNKLNIKHIRVKILCNIRVWPRTPMKGWHEIVIFNSLRAEQNGRKFVKAFSFLERDVWLKRHWS